MSFHASHDRGLWHGGRSAQRGRRRGRGSDFDSSHRGPKLCFNFQRDGKCKHGDDCRYSHDVQNDETLLKTRRPRPARQEESQEQKDAKEEYTVWKRDLKRPPVANDLTKMKSLWSGALNILMESNKEFSQMLARDLDEFETSRLHILQLMEMQPSRSSSTEYVRLTEPFLKVITHKSLVHCLSIDHHVGHVYQFITGTNGNRAIPFFQRLLENLTNARLDGTMNVQIIEDTLSITSVVLHEIFRRCPRVAYNDAVLTLYQSSCRRFQAIIARAKATLVGEAEEPESGIVARVAVSTYPRDVVVPGGRHDNDHNDITKIGILPTLDEIRCSNSEYLPTTDFGQPHFLANNSERHIDTQFRLLRHEIFGEFKEALGGLLASAAIDPSVLRNKLKLGNVQAHNYQTSRIRHIDFDQRRGLEASVSFDEPAFIVKNYKSASERARWWQDSRRLNEGGLLCFVYRVGSQINTLFLLVSKKSTDEKDDFGLVSDETQPGIYAKLADYSTESIDSLLELHSRNIAGTLIEFPGVLLATFEPILQNLQDMQKSSRLPFKEWILPAKVKGSKIQVDQFAVSDMPPPLYAQKLGFSFSLDSILTATNDRLSLAPATAALDDDFLKELEDRSTLDRGQCQALINALTREFSLIQGPPGTGKSYIGSQLMRVLLDCKDTVKLGPVVVVCYTNHALDQFLEHLVTSMGVTKVIRIGGQSKSAILEGKNLRLVSKSENKTKHEGYILGSTYGALQDMETQMAKLTGRLQRIRYSVDWSALKYYLQRHYPQIAAQFRDIDEEGFQVQGRHPFDLWARGGETGCDSHNQPPTPTSQLLARAESSASSLNESERQQLIGFWTHEVMTNLKDDISTLIDDSLKLRQKIANVHDEIDRRVLQTADVIGVTTTGLARRISVLKHIEAKVIICEEAGEVLEPHMISALIPSVEHFIQIGDHQQLRPQIKNFALSLESAGGAMYKFDRSQFERLTVGEPGRQPLPVAQLNVQRRMRPEISTLIRECLYPRLVDHSSTHSLPRVVGLRHNVFWLNHDHHEETQDVERQQMSRTNQWEIEMTHALIRHVVRQGVYAASDIAVLTPYTGQLQLLRKSLQNEYEIVLSERDEEALALQGFLSDDPTTGKASEVHEDQSHIGATKTIIAARTPLEKKQLSDMLRLATVDTFQGDEAKIVIISLVRSNKEKKVGFLKTTNRINVLLSRAQHGMYLIGNSDTYSNVPMWAKVLRMLESTGSVGPALQLCCPRHKDTILQVAEPLDFERLSPEGGCQLVCERRLTDCGHRCPSSCHSDSMHQAFRCPAPCQRLMDPCQHSCSKATCGEDCGLCTVVVHDIRLPCGHDIDSLLCYRTQDLKQVSCEVKVMKNVPSCGHDILVSCFVDVGAASFKCPQSCTHSLPCSHLCPGSCGQCGRGDAAQHESCTKLCARPFSTCNHTCPRLCHDGTACGSCTSDCQVQCAHNHCDTKCNEACVPCIEPCIWNCEHVGGCELPCSAPCDRLPCNKRCSQNLTCGCQCPSICGETCPEGYCINCSRRQDARVDFLEMKSYNEIDLDETPIVVLSCGHFFTAESLDGHIGLNEVYEIDGYGDFIGLKDICSEFSRSIPTCPDCKTLIRQYSTQRYNRLINRAVIDETSRRFLTSGKSTLGEFEEAINNLEQQLEDSRPVIEALLSSPGPLTAVQIAELKHMIQPRYMASSKLSRDLSKFTQRVSIKNQPAQKLHEATVSAARARSLAKQLHTLNINPPADTPRDQRILLGCTTAQLKHDTVTLADKFNINVALLKSSSSTSVGNIPGGKLSVQAHKLFKAYTNVSNETTLAKLLKLTVEAVLCYARIVHGLRTNTHPTTASDADQKLVIEHVEKAKVDLSQALNLCRDAEFANAHALLVALESMLQIFGKEHYEVITAAELAAIKQAMLSGSRGLATHSGHWYNCVNGHPFAIGECGMPMQEARCPECGSPIGGQGHVAVEGVTRAAEMEDR